MTIPKIGSLDTGIYVSFIFQHSSWSTLTNAWTFSFGEDPNLAAYRVFRGRRIILCLPWFKKERGGEFTPSFLVQRENNCFTNCSPTKKMWMIFIYPPPPRMPGTTRMTVQFVVGNPYKPSFVTGFLLTGYCRSNGWFS